MSHTTVVGVTRRRSAGKGIAETHAVNRHIVGARSQGFHEGGAHSRGVGGRDQSSRRVVKLGLDIEIGPLVIGPVGAEIRRLDKTRIGAVTVGCPSNTRVRVDGEVYRARPRVEAKDVEVGPVFDDSRHGDVNQGGINRVDAHVIDVTTLAQTEAVSVIIRAETKPTRARHDLHVVRTIAAIGRACSIIGAVVFSLIPGRDVFVIT